nr:hypothetical protein [Woeseiaceae bacterium]
RNYKFNAIQHGGQHTIVRKNLFTGNRGGGVAYQFYDDESRYVYGNRLYNNTFTKNRCGAIIGQSGSRKYMYDNIALNNLVYANEDCSGGGRQISIASRRAVQLVKNLVAADNPGIVLGRDGALCPTVGSRVVDTAAFATRTREAGAGHVIPVDDASWFSDGYGIVSGDLIQLAGGSDKYRVVEIAETADTIRIDRPAGWAKGDGIHLAFAGDGPDQGAFEFNGPRCANGADN